MSLLSNYFLSPALLFFGFFFPLFLHTHIHTLSTQNIDEIEHFPATSCAIPPFNTHFIFKKEFDISVTMCLKFSMEWCVSVRCSSKDPRNSTHTRSEDGQRCGKTETENWMRFVIGLDWNGMDARVSFCKMDESSIMCVCVSRNVINFIEFVCCTHVRGKVVLCVLVWKCMLPISESIFGWKLYFTIFTYDIIPNKK